MPSSEGSGAERRVLLGRISGAHGIRGEVVIISYTGAAEDIAAYGPLSDAAGRRTFELTNARVAGKGVIARIAGIKDRNAAEALKGTELYVARAQLPETAEGEYYHEDLVGLDAVDEAGTRIGRVVGVNNFGAGDLLEIALLATGKTEFVPFTNEAVPTIDLAARSAVVRLPVYTGDEAGDLQEEGT